MKKNSTTKKTAKKVKTCRSDAFQVIQRQREIAGEDDEPHTSEAGLAAHVIAILNHPKVPNALYNAIGNFITDSTNIKDSTGESLVDRWTYAPATVAAACAWAKEEDDNKEIAAELTARVNAARGAQ